MHPESRGTSERREYLKAMNANFWRKAWLPRHERHPWDFLEFLLCFLRYPRWAARIFLWYDPPLRPGEKGTWLTFDQWAKYVDVYFGLERPSAEQHLSSRRIVQRKLSEWAYLFCLSLVVILAWIVIWWQQTVTADIRHVWPIEIIIVQYLIPPFALLVDWARHRQTYWQFDLRETHGTARWKRFDELRKKGYIVPRGQNPPGYAYLAPYNAIYDVVLPWEEMFRSRLFIGKPGSGKSSTFHANHLRLYSRDFNTVAVDIKGELYNQTAHYYSNVYRLDFRDPRYSDRFNLIRDCRGDITFTSKIAFTLIVATNKEAANSQNKYFYDAAKAVLTALILHLAEDNEHYPEATLNDLFYLLAGEYREVTESDKSYFINRVTEYIIHEFLKDQAEPGSPAGTGRNKTANLRLLRHRIRKTLSCEDVPVITRALYITYLIEMAYSGVSLENTRKPWEKYEEKNFEKSRYARPWYKKRVGAEVKEDPRLREIIFSEPEAEGKIEKKLFQYIEEYLSNPQPHQGNWYHQEHSEPPLSPPPRDFEPAAVFQKVYHLLSTLSPKRPDFRDFKKPSEYSEEGFFMEKENGRVARFLMEVFRNSPSVAARQSWATFQSSAGNDPRLLGNITSTLLTAIECFRDPTVNLCFRNPTPEEAARGCRIIDWNFLRAEPSSALFLVMSAAQSIQLAPVVATIFSVIMEKLLRELNDPTGQKKLRPCYLQVDEGGNFKIPGIAEFVATCRGSAVCVDYSVQSVLQLNHLYGNEYGEMLKEVFGTKIFLPGSEGKTAELASQLSGESTTRQRKIVDGPGNWQDREEDQEVKRNLVANYEARTLARHLEALCVLSDEPAIRISFPPFARDLDDRLTQPPQYTEDILPPSSPPPSPENHPLHPENVRRDFSRIIAKVFEPGEGKHEKSGGDASTGDTTGTTAGTPQRTPFTASPTDTPTPGTCSAGQQTETNSPSPSASVTDTSSRVYGMQSVLSMSRCEDEAPAPDSPPPPADNPTPHRPGMRRIANAVTLPSTESIQSISIEDEKDESPVQTSLPIS